MIEFQFPWLLLSIGLPLLAGIFLTTSRMGFATKIIAVTSLMLGFFAGLGGWCEFSWRQADVAHDPVYGWLAARYFPVLQIDRFSSPLLMLQAGFALLTVGLTMRTKGKRVPYGELLLSQSAVQCLYCCTDPMWLVILSGVHLIFPWLELKQRGYRTRSFLVQAGGAWVLLGVGYLLLRLAPETMLGHLGQAFLLLGIVGRCGLLPFHCGTIDLFNKLGFGTAILGGSALLGPLLAVRLGLPLLPNWGITALATVAVASAIYGAAMALVEAEVRRLYCYLFMSHTGLLLVGLEAMTLAGLGAGLALWLGSTTALVAFGLTLRSVEARFGRLSVAKFQGYYEHLPRLAGLGLVTGLAWIGFPGTVSFVAIELLADSAFHQNRLAGFGVVTAAALSSIAVLRVYFRLFTGHRHRTNVSVRSTWVEDWGISLLIVVLVGGSLVPQTLLVSRLGAAEQLLSNQSNQSIESNGSNGSHKSDGTHGS